MSYPMPSPFDQRLAEIATLAGENASEASVLALCEIARQIRQLRDCLYHRLPRSEEYEEIET